MKLYRSNTHDRHDYRTLYERWYNALPVAQQAAVYDYTDYGYRSLNHVLRYGKELSDHERQMREHLDAALHTAPPPGTLHLFRAVKTLRDPITPGQRVTYPYYLSTTTDPHQIFKFANHDAPVVFELKAHTGVPVSDIHEEYEFLLPRNTAFVVEDILHNIDWHAEYEGTDYSRSLTGVTVISMTQDSDDPRTEVPPRTTRSALP